MQKQLYFICPTDHLEPVIDDAFGQESYYISSLGNSIVFDDKLMELIKELIVSRDIREIFFVLSDENRIVLDAFENQAFSEIKSLDHFYNQITRNKKQAKVLWRTWNRQLLVLSYHMNEKIRELKLGLNGLFIDQLKISGKIYRRQESSFTDLYSDLLCIESYNLN